MKPAAISAQLVDMRNVGTHKSLKLTLHVPEEQAMAAIECFGWPTGTHPLPVAIALLDLEREVGSHKVDNSTEGRTTEPGAGFSPGPHRDSVATKRSLAQTIGMVCKDPLFREFLADYTGSTSAEVDEAAAATFVRHHCGVVSRANIVEGSPAAESWDRLYNEFLGWADDGEADEDNTGYESYDDATQGR